MLRKVQKKVHEVTDRILHPSKNTGNQNQPVANTAAQQPGIMEAGIHSPATTTTDEPGTENVVAKEENLKTTETQAPVAGIAVGEFNPTAAQTVSAEAPKAEPIAPGEQNPAAPAEGNKTAQAHAAPAPTTGDNANQSVCDKMNNARKKAQSSCLNFFKSKNSTTDTQEATATKKSRSVFRCC